MSREYLDTVIEIAIHSRWVSGWLYGSVPFSIPCLCKFCKAVK